MAEKEKHVTFANAIIAVCIAVSLLVTLLTMYEYHRLDTVPPAGVVVALLGMWGGELLIIALRQIFGSDVMEKKRSLPPGDDGASI